VSHPHPRKATRESTQIISTVSTHLCHVCCATCARERETVEGIERDAVSSVYCELTCLCRNVTKQNTISSEQAESVLAEKHMSTPSTPERH